MNKFTLDDGALSKWLHNILLFLAPLVIVYLGSVISALQAGFSVAAFIPGTAFMGALSLYITNAILDYFRKLK